MAAIGAVSCCWLNSDAVSRSSLFSHTFRALAVAHCNNVDASCNSSTSANTFREADTISHKFFFGKPKDERPTSFRHRDARRKDMGRSQSSGFQSLVIQKKDKKGSACELKEQQAEAGNFQDATFLNAVVKVYCTHTAPDYSLPWQKQRQYTSTGSAFMIGNGKFLTNAHCVEHDTQGGHASRRSYIKVLIADGIFFE